MKNMTIEHIAAACGGTIIGTVTDSCAEVTSIETDSRKVQKGSLFVAIRGERVDAHKFIPQVIGLGVSAILAEQAPEMTEQAFGYESGSCAAVPTIVVESTLQAVKDIAEFYLRQVNIPVVGIVGSVGKTSTKEMVSHVLQQKYRTLKTEGNFNNELGVPMTAFRIRDEHEIGVLEMGINHFGEMHRLAKIVRPNTVVMTNIGTAHLEFLESRDGILRAKSEVFDFFEEDGHIILNGDDDKLSLIEEVKGVRPFRFGLEKEGYSHPNDFWASDIQMQGLRGTSCVIHTPSGSFEVMIPTPGKHMILNALAGTAVGTVYGMSMEQIRAGIENYEALSGRFHIIYTDQYTIVDDCYNANPGSMQASLDILRDGEGRRIAILGDMGELGAEEKALHASVGAYAAACDVDALYCVGPLSRSMAEAAEMTRNEKHGSLIVRHFETREDLLKNLDYLVQSKDTILIKASHYMHFEEIVAKLQSGNSVFSNE